MSTTCCCPCREDAVANIIGATNNDDDCEYEFDKIVSHYDMRNERGKMERPPFSVNLANGDISTSANT